eukprot:TRINITY_DN11858_c0_g1_i1.p2 TRINITY_DN11858_c0_g1~~TRINITY_DN11858_c0_g1_i1.p2  ORF type:complete len:256 (-),score=63.34 TRINITY_DN11858_c0_g1_i1:100-867(-)
MSGKLQLTVLSARELPASKPYVKFTWREQKYKTNHMDQTTSPSWNQTFVIPVSPQECMSGVTVEVWDYHSFLSNQLMSRAVVPFHSLTQGQTVTQWFPLKGSGARGEIAIGLLALDFSPQQFMHHPQQQGAQLAYAQAVQQSMPPAPLSRPVAGTGYAAYQQRHQAHTQHQQPPPPCPQHNYAHPHPHPHSYAQQPAPPGYHQQQQHGYPQQQQPPPPPPPPAISPDPVSYTHLRAHETPEHLVCRLLLEKKKKE